MTVRVKFSPATVKSDSRISAYVPDFKPRIDIATPRWQSFDRQFGGRGCDMARFVVGLAAVAAAALLDACAGLAPPPPPRSNTANVPRDIRTGAAEMVIQSVEREVSREEVAAALQRLIGEARSCVPWPSLWIEGEDRRTVYLVRFDLMARDWGEDVAAESRTRMQEFVDMGLLSRRERPDIGPGAVAFSLTREGAQVISGSMRSRLAFCLSPERQVVEITSLDWGEFECGSLRVNFTHVARVWPSWARTEASQRRAAQTWSGIGQSLPGSVTLSRQWYQPNQLPPGVRQNGELRSLCYDAEHQRVIGGDLNLNPTQPYASEALNPLEQSTPVN